jgi:hypothetical protein
MAERATHMGAPFDHFNPEELSEFASEVVARADAEVPGFSNLGVASLLMDHTAWSLVGDYLVTEGERRLNPPDANAPVLCDLQTHAHRAQDITGRFCLTIHEGRDAFFGRERLRPGLERMATSLSDMANTDARSCNLRGALNIPGAPEKVAQLGIVGWGTLIQKKTSVVLPLFERGSNGCVAAGTINQIARAAPHVAYVSISGGPKPADGNLIVDLTSLRSDHVPEVEIRIKETLLIKTVKVLAPPHVAIRLERDASNVNVRNAGAPVAITRMELERRVNGDPIATQVLQFGETARPLPPLAPASEHDLAALAGADPLIETAVAASSPEQSSEGKRD